MSTPYAERPWRNRLYKIRVLKAVTGDAWDFGWKTVNGYVCPPFAARKKDGGGWSCDHMPTGATVGGFRLLAQAKDYARELVEEADGPEAWEGFTEVGDMPEDLRKINQRVGQAWNQLLRAVG